MRPTGLLKKAKAIRASFPPPLRVLGPHELRVDDDEMNAEDRAQALEQVEQAIARSREAIAPETLAFRPRRRGTLLPLLVNLLALVLIAGGIVFAVRLSRRAEQAAAAGPATLLSAEGKVLQTLREESRRELEGKDREIAAIRERLAGIDGERKRLRDEAEAALRGREQELTGSIAIAVEEERRRLAAGGLSEEAIARKLLTFEAGKRESIDQALAAFRAEQEEKLAAGERAIEALQAEYQAELSRAQADRGRIQEQAARRQAEMEAGYRQKQLVLEQDKAAALAELARLREQQERERLAADQLLSYYARARDELAASRPDGALAAVADLRRALDEPAVASLPAIARRRPVDLFLAASLEQMVRAQAAGQEAARDTQVLVASASLVAAAASLVEQGDALFAAGDYAKARELYLSALARIPAAEAGYARLAEIERITAQRETKAVAAAFASGNAAYRAGDFDAAVERYGSALRMLQVERGVVDSTVSQLIDIGALRRAGEAAAVASAQPDPAGEAATLVAQGDASFAGQDYAKARELYLAALARVPAAQAGHARLAEIDAIDAARAGQAVDAVLAEGNAAYEAGNYDAAVERYGLAVQLLQGRPGAGGSLVARLLDIGSRRKASEIAAAEGARPDPGAEAASLVAQGDALLAGEDYANARELYLAALSRVPAAAAGHERLQEIEAVMRDRASGAVAAALAEGSAASEAGDHDTAIERYGLALQLLQVEQSAADAMVSQLLDAGSRRAAARAEVAEVPATAAPDADAEARARSAAWLQALRAGLDTPGASPDQVAAAGSALVALLETKLLVQKTLLSPEVAARSPGLYEGLEKYLEALAEESRADGQLAILAEIDSLLAGAAAAGPGPAPSPTPEAIAGRYPAAEQRGLLVRILDRLQALLR